MSVYCYGYVRNDDSDLVPVIGYRDENTSYRLYFNNDPYGIYSIFGLKDLELEAIDTTDSSIEDLFAEYIDTGSRGECVGVINMRGKLLFVKDYDAFTCEIQNKKYSGEPGIEYDGFVDSGDASDNDEDIDEIIDILINGIL